MTGLLCTAGAQFSDWSAAYRLFARERLPVTEIFAVTRRAVTATLAPEAPFCAALDDTLVRRGGRKTPGSAWRRDPLGPPFQANLVRAQRFLQLSAALPGAEARMTPIVFRHAPSVAKPGRQASTADLSRYRAETRRSGLSAQAATQIRELRTQLDQDCPDQRRPLWITFDGSYTNSAVLKNIPPHTLYIGRLRKDARLHHAPTTQPARGRKLSYGANAPTPDQLRRDDSQPWQTLAVTHAGITHQVRFKSLAPVLWRTAGAALPLRLIVIAPLKYRPRKGGRLLYRDPAYLICTDPQVQPEVIVQTYLKRWDIEVNFRDEKTLIGVGQAQVRNAHSVETAPALAVAAYSLLLTAAHSAFTPTSPGLLPQPKWAASSTRRLSTQRLLQQLRAEVWGRGLGLEDFSPFASHTHPDTKAQKCSFPLASAVCYANG